VERGEGWLRVEESVDPPKDKVSWSVAAAAVAPPVDHSLIVTEDPEMSLCTSDVGVEENVDKELEPDGFSPPDVSSTIMGLPS
jgi:hypothetical protein